MKNPESERPSFELLDQTANIVVEDLQAQLRECRGHYKLLEEQMQTTLRDNARLRRIEQEYEALRMELRKASLPPYIQYRWATFPAIAKALREEARDA